MDMHDRENLFNDEFEEQGGFFVHFFGGPLDGIEGWTERVSEAMAVPVNPEVIDNPVTISPTLLSDLPPTSVNLYRLKEHDGRLVYVFDGAVKPRD